MNTSRQCKVRFYFDRTAGSHCNYCDFSGDASAGAGGGHEQGEARHLPVQFSSDAGPRQYLRSFQKTSATAGVGGGHKILALDSIGGGFIGGTTPSGYNPYAFPHYPSKGWDVLFIDGSVKLCKSVTAYNIVTAPGFDADGATPTIYEPILQALEDAR